MTTPAYFYGHRAPQDGGRPRPPHARRGRDRRQRPHRSSEHFGNAIAEAELRLPFRVTGTEGRYNAMIKVEGGGVPPARPAPSATASPGRSCRSTPRATALPLRQAGLLTRDPRMKERKKYGLKRARKAPQYTKR